MMSPTWSFATCIVLASLSVVSASTSAAHDDIVPGELVVRLEPGATGVAQRISSLHGVTRARALVLPDTEVWSVPVGREHELATRLSGERGVLWAEPNVIYHAFTTTPNDPGLSHQWGHTRIHSAAAWDLTTGSDALIIAIIDTGIDESHPDLAGKLVAGFDFVDDDADPHDLNGHGTHVAGIAAAVTDNGIGIAGTSWGARLMPVRVLGETGSGTSADIASGIAWAATNGANVINLSLGGPTYTQATQDAVDAAWGAGVLVVAAMGNFRTQGNPTMYPAASNHVLAVSATKSNDTYAFYSQYGDHCDLAAPGGEMAYYHDPNGVYSTMPTYSVYLTTHDMYSYLNYDTLQGTSQAAPFVAGAAALVRTIAPGLGPDAVQQLLESTTTDLGPVGWDPDYGWGLLHSEAAVEAATVIFADGFETGTTDEW